MQGNVQALCGSLMTSNRKFVQNRRLGVLPSIQLTCADGGGVRRSCNFIATLQSQLFNIVEMNSGHNHLLFGNRSQSALSRQISPVALRQLNCVDCTGQSKLE